MDCIVGHKERRADCQFCDAQNIVDLQLAQKHIVAISIAIVDAIRAMSIKHKWKASAVDTKAMEADGELTITIRVTESKADG